MARESIKARRECDYCKEMFAPKPHSRRNFICEKCEKKSYEFGRMKRSLISFQRMLLVLGGDKNKDWYKRFYDLVKEFGGIVKKIARELRK